MLQSSRGFLVFLALLLLPASLPGEHRLITQGNGKLVILDKQEQIEWELKWGGIHDLHVLPNGNILVPRNNTTIVEIDPVTKQEVWSYNASQENGNKGKRIEVHAFQPLPNGHLMIAESGRGRIIEIDRKGAIHKEVKLTINNPHPHRDTRLVRKLQNGNYLVSHERDGAVREYDGKTGKVIWEYEVPLFGKKRKKGHGPEAFGNAVFCAIRLKNGNTLIATGNGHSVLEVTREKKIVWEVHQKDLSGITLAWVTTLEVLPNGNYVVGNCHAGPGNPLLIEIDPKTKKVVWQLDQFQLLGNSVPTSQLLGIKGAVIR